MAGPENERESTPELSVVLLADTWGPGCDAWVHAWEDSSESPVELIVVDQSSARDLVTRVPSSVRVVESHRGTTSMALNSGLEVVTTPRVLFQPQPRLPPADFLQQLRGVDATCRCRPTCGTEQVGCQRSCSLTDGARKVYQT